MQHETETAWATDDTELIYLISRARVLPRSCISGLVPCENWRKRGDCRLNESRSFGSLVIVLPWPRPTFRLVCWWQIYFHMYLIQPVMLIAETHTLNQDIYFYNQLSRKLEISRWLHIALCIRAVNLKLNLQQASVLYPTRSRCFRIWTPSRANYLYEELICSGIVIFLIG